MTAHVDKTLRLSAGGLDGFDTAIAWVLWAQDEHFPDDPDEIHLRRYTDVQSGGSVWEASITGTVQT